MFELAVTGSTSVFLFIGAFTLQTNNMKYAFLFKFVPFILGVVNGIIFLKKMGWIVQI